MKNNYPFLVLSLALWASSGTAQQLTPELPTWHQPTNVVHTSVQNVNSMSVTMDDEQPQPTYTDWETRAGSWVYVSNYLKKSYPTIVRSRVKSLESDGELQTQNQLELTNALFGKAILYCNPESGAISLLSEEGGEVNLLDSEGQPTENYVYVCSMPTNGAPSRIMQYVASECIEIALTMVKKYDPSEGFDYENAEYITYDYLYNSEVQPAKIDVEMPCFVKEPFSLEGKCGAAVSDLYFVMALSNRNEQRAEQYPEYAENGFPVDYKTIPVMLSEYISSGKTNPAVKISKVSVSETGEFKFDVNDRWEGLRGLSLIAYRDGEICDQKFAYVEMHGNAGWKNYKDIDINYDLPAILSDDNQIKRVNLKTEVEINDSAKLMRICNPYGDFDSDFNYFYIDYSLGMDKCFITAGYTPKTYSYTCLQSDMSESEPVTRHHYLNTIIYANMVLGFTPEMLYDAFDGYGFFDLSTNVSNVQLLVQDENRFLYNNGIYVQGASDLMMAFSDVSTIELDNNYVLSVTMGSDVTKIEFAFVNRDRPTEKSKTYQIDNTGDVVYAFDILPELAGNSIPKTADAVSYTFFDKSGAIVRSGIMETDVNLAADVAMLSFDPEIDANTSGYRVCDYLTTTVDKPTIVLYDFYQSAYFTGDRSTNTLTIVVEEDGTPDIGSAYLGELNFGAELGMCKVYAETLSGSVDKNVITAQMQWRVYSDGNYVGYWQSATATITLPEHYLQTSGVEDIIAGDDANANTAAEYFNLQGQRVANPRHGNLYIERKAGKVRKILY